MTDLPPKSGPDLAPGGIGAPASGSGRGLRLALAVSVALNLAVAGIIGGAMLRADGPRATAMPRDLGFGVFTEALTPENRAELRRRLRQASPDFPQERRAATQDLTAIVTALRAEPFDKPALDMAMQRQIDRLATRLEVGQVLLLDYLSALSPAERRAFADRLEGISMRHGDKHSGPAAD